MNEQLSNGDTPLHWAVGNKRENLVEGLTGSLLIIQILLSKNANPNKKNKRGGIPKKQVLNHIYVATPLEWAINTENVESARFLLSAGASFDPTVLTNVSRASFSSSGSNNYAVRELCILFLGTFNYFLLN